MSQKSINELNLNSITISNSNYSNSEGFTAQSNTLQTNNAGALLVNGLPIGSGGAVDDIVAGNGISVTESPSGSGTFRITNTAITNIRSAVYWNLNGAYIPITSNTVYTHQFIFNNFNVTPESIVNVTYAGYNTTAPGTIIDPNTVPIWETLSITPFNTGFNASITVNFIGILLSGIETTLELQGLHIMIMNI